MMNRAPLPLAVTLLIFMVGLELLGTMQPGANEGRRKPMSGTQLIFDAVKDLYSRRPLRVETIAAATGVPLHLDTTQSNKYFSIYEGAGKPDGMFTNVEARIPAASAQAKDGLVAITLNNVQSCIDKDEVIRRFGAGPELRPPDPKGPAELPLELIYRFEWGALSFGFPTRGRECLSSIVVDATGA